MKGLADKDNSKFYIRHPGLFLFAVFIICVLFAKGDSSLMTPFDTGVVMASLAASLAYFTGFKWYMILIIGAVSGVTCGAADIFTGSSDPILTAGGAILITAAAIYAGVKKRGDHDLAAVLMLTAGFWLQFCYAQYTPCWLRQNDVGFFYKEVFDPHHAGYICYIRYYGWIPYADVREMDQWYHPPLHHLICAYFLRFYSLVFPKYEENYDILQMLTLMYSFLSVVYTRKVIRFFDLSERTDRLLTLLIAVFPIFIINAGELNNDILSILLFIMSVYFIFRWYTEDYSIGYLIGSAFAIGLGMMAKLSVWMAAVPVGTILLVSLIRSKGKDLRLWGQYGLFALISFPLGLWFPVRNYIGWGVPPSYIPVPFYTESLERYSVWQRLFDVFDNSGYYNIPYFALWSAVFDDDDYRANMFYGLLSFAVFAVFALIVILAFAGIIYMTVKAVKSRKAEWKMISLILLLIAELVSYTVFCFKFPYLCTMNFRYIVPVTLPAALGLGVLYDRATEEDKLKLLRRGIDILAVFFAVASAVFYLTLWWYDIWLEAQIV